MRPNRLEVQGFASFRDNTTVDLDGTDLFVLTGPTGSGKSSLIDAMVFALYGSVPRYDDRRVVAPVITQGKVEARVRLDFTADGDSYTAVRIVRRTGTGATTKEARLERPDGGVVADGADDLTAAVVKLLGLPFEHFTKCVVLPQGDFAEFLHAKWGDRRDLLVRLLDLDVYGRVREAANQRAAAARSRLDLLDTRLAEDLAGATVEARDAAAERVGVLEALRERIQDARPELDDLRDEFRDAQARADQATGRADSLARLEVPDGVAELSRRLTNARRELTDAEQQVDATAEAVDGARAAVDEQPAAADLAALREAHARRPELAEVVSDLQQRAEAARAAEQDATARATAADDALASARAALDDLRREHSAAALAAHLAAGEPCPVCRRTVDAPPDVDPPVDLDRAAAQVEACQRDAAAARKHAAEVGQRRASVETELDGARTRLAAVEEQLDGQPGADEVGALLEQVQAATAALDKQRERARAARAALKQARRAVAGLKEQRDAAWAAFDSARDGVAGLNPPAPDRDDLAAAWEALVGWAGERAPQEQAAADEAARRAAQARTRGQKIQQALRQACADAGVEVGDGEPRDACAETLAEARTALRSVEQGIDEAQRLRAERKDTAQRQTLAAELGRHLSANKFERWLLNRALGRLVGGASLILRDLTQNAYSLALDDTSTFQVVDHRSADEVRPARTLSGGETFLASLSLALALAEHVAEMAAHGGARLEALFLDEGFGTLDPETLETVATAIEELHARGRMVGLVTHVRELAERMPVRFEVTRGPGGSSVERVSR